MSVSRRYARKGPPVPSPALSLNRKSVPWSSAPAVVRPKNAKNLTAAIPRPPGRASLARGDRRPDSPVALTEAQTARGARTELRPRVDLNLRPLRGSLHGDAHQSGDALQSHRRRR